MRKSEKKKHKINVKVIFHAVLSIGNIAVIKVLLRRQFEIKRSRAEQSNAELFVQ